ncbi:hypothetical protein MUK42_22517 [Musa troglodytarum]|uniref:Uncharacterized protein n=1 Tax=Musa troglodytarum TaxID=320322 RepID=A0A9E7JIP6_9LILI|nr:hypothetical protein MUK42_22517 [Musa troglodytarum]
MPCLPMQLCDFFMPWLSRTLGSPRRASVTCDAFGVRSGWRAGPRGWLAPWAPRRFLRRFSFPKIVYPAYKSGRDGSPPTPPKVKIITGRGIYDISALCSENERHADLERIALGLLL